MELKAFIRNKMPIFLIYSAILVLAVFLMFFKGQFHYYSWFTNLLGIYLILTPGFLLKRIFRISFLNDLLGNLVLSVALGFVFNLSLAFGAIVVGLNIILLTKIYLFLFMILFVLGIVLEIVRNKEKYELPAFKKIFILPNLIYLLVPIFGFLILLAVDQQGANLKGDPAYHLAIMRKVIDGEALNPGNLNYIKTAQIHPAYGFPIWHIFLGLIAKLAGSNIFTVWIHICTSLTFMVILVWTWFARRIMPSRETAILTVLLLMAFAFRYLDGYFFTRLSVPDTLNQFLLLPLVVSLAIEYIFNLKKHSIKLLVVLSIVALLMGAIHLTQYVYFLMIVSVLGLVYAVSFWKDQEYKNILKRIGFVLGANIAVIAPLAVLLEMNGHVVSNVIKLYWNENIASLKLGYRPFKGIEPLAKYAYISFPLILIFVKKHRQLIFLFSLFLVMPLAYSETIGFIKIFLMKTLGYIFLNRLYSNVTWDFLIWGLILGFIVCLIDKLIFHLTKGKKVWQWVLSFFMLVALAFGIWLESSKGLLSKTYKGTIVLPGTLSWLNGHYLWLVLGILIIVLAVLIGQKYLPKLDAFFEIKQTKHPVAITLIICLIAFFFFSPNYKNTVEIIKREFTKGKTSFVAKDQTGKAVNINNVGGTEAIEFIRNNVPAKSIFVADKASQPTLTLLTDQFMAAYPRTPEEKFNNRIFQPDLAIEKKLEYLNSLKADYIFMSSPEKEGEAHLNQYPQYFKQIYRGKVAIYEVIIP